MEPAILLGVNQRVVADLALVGDGFTFGGFQLLLDRPKESKCL